MYDIAKDLLDALRATPVVLNTLLRGYTQEQAPSTRSADDGWSVVEIVCHLRDAEERAIERMRLMRDQDDPFLAGYDQEQWAQARDYVSASLHEVLAAFTRFRALHVAELAALAAEHWERTGRHEEQGRITITAHTVHIASHDLSHMAQLARQ